MRGKTFPWSRTSLPDEDLRTSLGDLCANPKVKTLTPKECDAVGKKSVFTVRASRCFWRSDAGERTGDCGAEATAEEDPTEVRCSDPGAIFWFLLMPWLGGNYTAA